tara:strand:+ start:668 stop:1108 length:441 start_codon:yes stop_codon:yes gene_type:complete
MDKTIQERSYGLEAIKTALRQTKDGIAITLVVHPNDIPADLMSDPIGSRYMVGMARLDDDDTIITPPSVRENNKIVNQAGMLCREDSFQDWLFNQGIIFEKTEAAAADAVRLHCGIKSRSELASNDDARKLWAEMLGEFESRGYNA